MNFDLLVTILFIVFFLVGPFLQRAGRNQRRNPPTGRGSGPNPRQTGSAPPQPRADDSGSLSERLEEARRRVLEAMGEQPRGAAQRRPPEASSPPRSQRDLDWQKPVDWQESGLNWQEVVQPTESFMTTRAKRSHLRSESGEVISAPPLRTERRRASAKTAKLPVGRGFGTGRDAITSGIIWHEILSEPVSKRGNRRQPSRLRSR